MLENGLMDIRRFVIKARNGGFWVAQHENGDAIKAQEKS